jgi:AcrR family transcriptional regulator
MYRHKMHQQTSSATNSAFQRIITAARRHFLAHGFRSVTMDDLAEELGMSKKTLYASFSSKAALLEAVLRDKFRDIDADLHHITSECSDVPAALHQLLACVQRHTEEIQPPFVRDMRRVPDMFKFVENGRRDVIRRYFSKLLDEGRRAGMIRKDIPTQYIIEILLAAVQAILNPPKMAELDLTPKSGFATIITVILQGALTETGRAKL